MQRILDHDQQYLIVMVMTTMNAKMLMMMIAMMMVMVLMMTMRMNIIKRAHHIRCRFVNIVKRNDAEPPPNLNKTNDARIAQIKPMITVNERINSCNESLIMTNNILL